MGQQEGVWGPANGCSQRVKACGDVGKGEEGVDGAESGHAPVEASAAATRTYQQATAGGHKLLHAQSAKRRGAWAGKKGGDNSRAQGLLAVCFTNAADTRCCGFCCHLTCPAACAAVLPCVLLLFLVLRRVGVSCGCCPLLATLTECHHLH